MTSKFLAIKDHDDLAHFLGARSYKALGAYLYDLPDQYKYKNFSIKKKSGADRHIQAPRRVMKGLQSKISEALYEIYPNRPSAHGFAKERSIVTNANRHLDKTFIFNIDLSDFFTSIHFGRVRNLFMAKPFNFNRSVATVVAQVCCYENHLPQGAPSSPVVSNMICWKMDAELQQLAKVTNSTYSRYADDITFSFTCSRRRLPEELVILRGGEAGPGHALREIIVRNGFEINYEKVRLAGPGQRKEVTGITVNEFPNVSRSYMRKIHSILYAWKKFGYEAAEKHFNEQYDQRQRSSDSSKSLLHVLRGKLAFLRSVRGARDPIYQKLASRFNGLVEDENLHLRIIKETPPEQAAIDSLWVIEACYDDDRGEAVIAQGTGFMLEGFGLVTCAHVVTRGDCLISPVTAHKWDKTHRQINIRITHLDKHRDIAICQLDTTDKFPCISLFDGEIVQGLSGRLLGFPAYKIGQTAYISDTKIASIYPQSGLSKFEIDQQIREGNSGGPVVSSDGRVLGVALEGARKDSGSNAVLHFKELAFVLSDEYKI